nr:NDR1/HIN1-like protein 6 [Tanacetum cinerariifolium]
MLEVVLLSRGEHRSKTGPDWTETELVQNARPRTGPKWYGPVRSGPGRSGSVLQVIIIGFLGKTDRIEDRIGPKRRTKYVRSGRSGSVRPDDSDQDARYALSKLLQRGTAAEYETHTTLGEAFFIARIMEARFETIAGKKLNIKEKIDIILSWLSEETPPVIKGSLDAIEDIGVVEVSSAIDDVFDIDECNVESMKVRSEFSEFSENKEIVKEVVVGGGEACGVGEDELNRVISALKDGGGEFDGRLDEINLNLSEELADNGGKVIFEGAGSVTAWVVEGKRSVLCYVQGSGRRKMKKCVGCCSGRQENYRSGRRDYGRIRIWDLGIKIYFRHHLEDKVVVKEWGMIRSRLPGSSSLVPDKEIFRTVVFSGSCLKAGSFPEDMTVIIGFDVDLKLSFEAEIRLNFEAFDLKGLDVVCWCLGFVGACFAYYFYTTDKPKAPTYDIQSFKIKSLEVQPDFSLKTEFEVDVKTNNPNKNIGFKYGENSSISVLYHNNVISSGKLPAFKQDPENTTVLKISLSGTSEDEPGSLQDDMKNNKNNGEISLVVHVRLPLKVFVGNFGLKEVSASVSCDLVVDNMEEGKTAKVLRNDCEPDVEF